MLIATAGRRPDHAFGFRMFSESSTLHVALLRDIDSPTGHGTLEVPAPGGTWTAKDASGVPHRFSFHERVHDPVLASIDATVFASYGAEAQLSRLAAALDDVATHTAEDAETRRLVAEVTVQRNGHEPYSVRLASAPRIEGSP